MSPTYGYGDAGNRTWVKRANGKGDVYQYDAINQLTNVEYEASHPDTTPSGWTNAVGYVFDAAGNRESVTDNNGTTSYTANNLNQYTNVGGTTLQYDLNGSLTNDGTWTYTYDRENRLTIADNGTVSVTNVYDCFDRLIERDTASGKTRFVYDHQWRLVAEYDGSDTLIAKYVYGPELDEPVRMNRGGTNYYYHEAALNTVTEITDSSGNLVEQYRYDVYGTPSIYDSAFSLQTSSLIGNRLMFDGRDRDPDTGLYNIRHRYYSPSLGRWLTRDPIEENGGFNLYVYVANNPINDVDPNGDIKLFNVFPLAPIIWNIYNQRHPIPVPRPALPDPTTNVNSPPAQVESPVSGDPGLGGKPPIYIPPEDKPFEPVEPGRRGVSAGAPGEGECLPINGIEGDPVGGGCLRAGTLVDTAFGMKPIETVKLGEKVWSYNKVTHKIELAIVTGVEKAISNCLTKVAVNGEVITCTHDHPFYTSERGWMKAELIGGPGIRVKAWKSGTRDLIDLQAHTDTFMLNKTVLVYNLIVQGNHDYFVGKDLLLAHNGGPVGKSVE